MTSANIAGFVSGRNAEADISVNSGTGRGGKTETGGISFAAVIAQQGMQADRQQFTPDAGRITGREERTERISDPSRAAEQFSGKDKTIVRKEADAAEDTAALQERIAEAEDTFGDGVKEILKEELGVTEEQVEEAMELLGISYLELMNPSQLSQLVAQLTGTEDTCELLMSESLRGIIQQVDALSQSLAQEMGIPREQLTLLVSRMTEPVLTEELQTPAGTGETVPTDDGMTMQEQKTAAESAEAELNTADPARKPQTEEAMPQEAEQSGKTERTVITVNEVTQETSMEQPEQNGTQLDTQTGRQDSGQEKNSVANQEHTAFAVRNEAAVETAQPQETVSYTTADIDVESIMRQISEFARVNFSLDRTSMEMQLNPQNLGKLYLHVSTTSEGNVTAQIAATDENVKELLEAQVADLRASLNQQGIKVNAIEVTVASHEYERNLEQNAAGEQQQAEDREQQSAQTRRIFRGELDELSGLMSEEEILAARIMKDHGNTMDVTA